MKTHQFVFGRYFQDGWGDATFQKIERQLCLSEEDAIEVLADMMDGDFPPDSFFIGTMPWTYVAREMTTDNMNRREDLFVRALELHRMRSEELSAPHAPVSARNQ